MKPGQEFREEGSRECQETMSRKHPGIRGRKAGSQGAKRIAEALASGGSWRRLPSMGAVGGIRPPSSEAQTQGAGSRGASSRTRFFFQLRRSWEQ